MLLIRTDLELKVLFSREASEASVVVPAPVSHTVATCPPEAVILIWLLGLFWGVVLGRYFQLSTANSMRSLLYSGSATDIHLVVLSLEQKASKLTGCDLRIDMITMTSIGWLRMAVVETNRHQVDLGPASDRSSSSGAPFEGLLDVSAERFCS